VVSGVLDSLQRDQADDLIKRHGGRVTGSVSGKTSFLVVGTNCGRSKLNSVRAISEKCCNKPCHGSLSGRYIIEKSAARPASWWWTPVAAALSSTR